MRDTRGRDGKTGCYARMENKTLKIQIINLRCYTVVAGEPDVVMDRILLVLSAISCQTMLTERMSEIRSIRKESTRTFPKWRLFD